MNLDLLLPQTTATDTWVWATVTQASPLRIKLDGETTALDITPDTLVSGLVADDRVRVQLATNSDPSFKARRLVVIGKSGGDTPTGVITAFGGADAPTGWLLCNGSAVSRTTYARLYAVIGTTYGVGDGSATFNVPNLKGRVPVGLDSGQSEFDTLGEPGGAKTHTLATNELPSHAHPVRMRADGSIVSGNLQVGAAGNTYAFDGSGTVGGQTGAGATGNSGTAGSGAAHNNLQPYLVVNYIVKT